MIRIEGLSVPVSDGRSWEEIAAERLSLRRESVRRAEIVRRAVDARRRHGAPVCFSCVLDVETEEAVLRNIVRRHPNKAIILSTHRPGALKLCQKIYRIRDGCIEEASPPEVESLLSNASGEAVEVQQNNKSEQETFLREQAANAVPAGPELLRSEDESKWWMP